MGTFFPTTRATARANIHAPETQEYLVHAATQAPATILRAFITDQPHRLVWHETYLHVI